MDESTARYTVRRARDTNKWQVVCRRDRKNVTHFDPIGVPYPTQSRAQQLADELNKREGKESI